MELYFVDRDIPVVVVKAEGFPQGIGGAWQKLYAAFPPEAGRNYYGISYPESPGNIIYWAAVEIPNAETAAGNGLERYTIPGGKYISTFIEDFKKDETQVAKVFQQLLHSGFVADHGICLEIYSGENSVRCLVTHR